MKSSSKAEFFDMDIMFVILILIWTPAITNKKVPVASKSLRNNKVFKKSLGLFVVTSTVIGI